MRQRKTLGNGVLSDVDLREWGNRNIPQFKGVFDRTKFPSLYPRLSPGDSIILNLDPNYEEGGTHWVALRISNEAPLVFYKDSFGAPCPTEVIEAVNADGKRGLLYGNKIDQKISEENCGKRAAYFLRDIANDSRLNKEIEFFEKYG